MNNKKLLFILIPAVFLIWGMISYKIITNVNDDEQFNTTITSDKLISAPQKELTDSFKLLLDYRDPFLTNYKKARTTPSKPNNDKKLVKEVMSIKKTEVWPTIVYSGMIKQKSSQKKVGMIQIGQKEYLIREHQEVDEFHIIRITSDSVVLKRGKDKKVIYQ